MHDPYSLHSMSKLYREEALRDARTRHLRGRLRAERRRSILGGAERSLAWGGLMTLLHAARSAWQTAGRSEEQR